MKATRTVIEPQSNFSLRLHELWQYRELFYFFTWRDIKVKYKQTYLGILWSIIQPLFLMLLFTLVFARHFSPVSNSIDYKSFVLSALILWTLFYSATSHAAESIITQVSIIKKIYFPRLIIIGSAILTALFDFFVAFIIFLLFCIFFRQHISWQAIFLFPAGILMILLSAFGIGSLLAALNVKFRDFRYALPFLLQLLFFSSQVVYPLKDIEQPWLKQALSLNPVNGAIEIFRGALTLEFDLQVIFTGLFMAIVLCISGLIYFRKTEAYFADLA
ncbi:MAG: transporter permease [Flavisolibacter sp.]|jgi:lipopolysaccharide transport system permease protein|nr:transporter permease [Flavisolibacter sp.]